MAAAAPANTVTVAVPAVPTVAKAVSPTNSGEEQVISSNSSPIAAQRTNSCTTAPELIEENEKLRKENVQLSNELSQLKGLCNNVLTLMTNYASSQLESTSVPEGKPLELLPAMQASAEEAVVGGGPNASCETKAAEAEVPKLFGVSIGNKRRRSSEGEEAEREEQNQTQSSQETDGGSDAKTQPPDGSNSDDPETPWLELGK